MTGEEAVAYLNRYSWSATRLGLGRTRELLARLGDPQKGLKFIHVAGSNGKGSACAMFESVLRAAGYRTGLYISPYIERFEERIQCGGEPISPEQLAAVTERVRNAAEAMADHPSQFELITAAAMLYYAHERCDIVVLEVGMGGEKDSTNAIDAPELAVIANIGLEHTEYLGNTIEEIAAAKAGIIKPGCACACYGSPPEAVAVLRRVCAEKGAALACADFSRLRPLESSLDGQRFAWEGREYRIPLLGPHQLRNAALVLTGFALLRERGWRVPEDAVRCGLARVRWPARMELLCREPLFLLDGGHNPQCAQAMARSLDQLLPGQKLVFLTGVLADKDCAGIYEPLLPRAAEFICVTPDSPRALKGEALAAFLRARGASAESCPSVEEAIALTLSRARGGPAAAFGSLYLAGEVRTKFPRWS